MSPPKVSLAGKDAPKPLDEAELADPPTVIAMGSVSRERQNCQRRKARRVICGVAFVIIIALATLGTMALVHRLRRHHRKHWSVCYGPKRLAENVDVDHDNKLIRVTHDPDEAANTPRMEILHEYKRGMVAYKDLDKKVCYIDRLDETFIDGYERWEAYEKEDRKDQKTLKVISHPIEVDVVTHILDIHITEHCSDSKSFWVQEIEETEVTQETMVVRV